MSQPVVGFNIKCFLDAAEELLRSDETLRALDLLNNLPGYYRDNEPEEITTLKRLVMKRIATASFYAQASNYELSAADNTYLTTHTTLRGAMIINELTRLNAQDLLPHIVDLGPGEFWLPRMLSHHKKLFTYEPSYLNFPSFNYNKQHFEEVLGEHTPDRPSILFAGEIIEHLHDEREIVFEMERRVGLADIVHISTPLYTFNYACKNFREIGDLGHLRTYTPREFHKTITDMFPQYEVSLFVSPILHARCVLRSTKFNIPKEISVG